jgi:DNA-binding MarR family transcriptional regulator
VSSKLLIELKQKKPFPSAYAEATVALLRTADLVRRHIESTIAPHGITGQQYNVLRILRGAGPEGLPTLEIANRMIEQTPGITRLLDRLEARELVTRKRCAEDRRQVLCFISAAGLELLAKLDAPVDAADHGALSALNPDQITQLLALLDGVRDSIQPENVSRTKRKELS